MSLLRRLSIPFQSWMQGGTPRAEDIHPDIKDLVFIWQLGGPDFTRVDAETLNRAEICGTSQSYADKVLKACHKSGIIDPETGRPDTSKIDRNIVKSMPVISVEKQRQLVMLLFFWEEEITRWRLLSAEEDDIRERLGEEGIREGFRIELEETLRIVRAKKRVLPSLRDQSGRVMGNEDEQLPTYDESRRAR